MDKTVCCVPIIVIIIVIVFSSFPPRKKRRRRRRKRRRETVYIYALKDGRKKFYVGQTNSPQIRLNQHIESANMFGTPKEKKIFWMLKMGKEPKMEIITKARSRQKANQVEKKYIRKWGTHNVLHR